MKTLIVNTSLKRQLGFTLIELLIVVSIVGILAMIGVNHFATYKGRAFDATAQSDLKAGIISEEANYADTRSYISCDSAQSCETTLPNFKFSRGENGDSHLRVFSFIASGDGQSYIAESEHAAGLKNFLYDSSSGDFTESEL